MGAPGREVGGEGSCCPRLQRGPFWVRQRIGSQVRYARWLPLTGTSDDDHEPVRQTKGNQPGLIAAVTAALAGPDADFATTTWAEEGTGQGRRERAASALPAPAASPGRTRPRSCASAATPRPPAAPGRTRRSTPDTCRPLLPEAAVAALEQHRGNRDGRLRTDVSALTELPFAPEADGATPQARIPTC
jgi:hypothetical protein